MIIYTIDELADILEFKLHIEREEKGEKFNSYKKKIINKSGKYVEYTLTKSPPFLSSENTSYRLNINAEGGFIGEAKLNLNSKDIEDFNEIIQTHNHFKKYFRDKNIDIILNSGE